MLDNKSLTLSSSRRKSFEAACHMDLATDRNPSLHTVQPATVEVRNLSSTVTSTQNSLEALKLWKGRRDKVDSGEERQKVVLDSITANMPSGSLTAIMGASGSGKTFDTRDHRPSLAADFR